jgi:hypothetical protein
MNSSTYHTDCHPTLVLINTSPQMLKITAVFEDINQGSTIISHFLQKQYNDILVYLTVSNELRIMGESKRK